MIPTCTCRTIAPILMAVTKYLYLLCAVLESVNANCLQPIEFNRDHFNKRLVGYTALNHSGIGLATCGRKCLLLQQCLSVNHHRDFSLCELNVFNSSQVASTEFESDKGWNFADVDIWPNEMAGSCKSKPCGKNQQCIPATPTPICLDVPGCEDPSTVEHATVKMGGTLLGNQWRYTCDPGYQTSDGKTPFEKVCQVNGKWTTDVTICDVLPQWVDSVLLYSSEYSSTRFSAATVIGPPDTYPNYGDIATSWAQLYKDAHQYIEVGFAIAVYITHVEIYETFNSGGVKRISAVPEGATTRQDVWTGTPASYGYSRIFSPSFPQSTFKSKRIRLYTDCSISNNWVEIDAVRLHGTIQP